jgi:hypothetical protein
VFYFIFNMSIAKYTEYRSGWIITCLCLKKDSNSVEIIVFYLMSWSISLKITLADVICYTSTFASCRLHITVLLLFIGLFLSHQIIFEIVLAITYWFKVDYCFPLFLIMALCTIQSLDNAWGHRTVVKELRSELLCHLPVQVN